MSYTDQGRRQPMSMAAAIALNAAIIGAIALSPLVVNPPDSPTRTTAVTVRPQLPPPDPKIDTKDDPKPFDPIYSPKSPIAPFVSTDPIRTTDDPPANPPGPVAGHGKDTAPDFGVPAVQPLPPVLKKPQRDMRFAQDFQPSYPSALLVREIEGSATIRVLVGTDGRVREALVVSATHPDFGKAAARQALKAWRFKPATRDGSPVEDWVTIPVTFQIN
ncbi:MAG: hypothetical protein RL481_309 [Pseudomonadota bacterium]|jgi:periplasmic protein TonB